jgi:predicted Fe-Mo cluster-binding NifX family protein
MKIGFSTDDFETITGHVGRCAGFKIVVVDNGKILDSEDRENTFTHNRRKHQHHHGDNHGDHGHKRLAEGLKDCQYLICSSAGWRLVEEMEAEGIKIIFTDEIDIESAALQFEKGDLEILEEGVCRH